MRYEIIEFNKKIPIRIDVNSIKEYPFHWNNSLEIILVTKGYINYSLGSYNDTLEEDNILLINPNEMYRIYNTSEDNIVISLKIDIEFCKRNFPELICRHYYYDLNEKQSLSNPKYKMIHEYTGKILWQIHKKQYGYEKEVKRILKSLLFHLDNYYYVLNFNQINVNEVQKERFIRVIDYVLENCKNRISLQEIADKEHLSVYYLSHQLKEKVGISFQEILNLMRVEVGAKILLDTDKKISEISLECGFSDSKYFNKNFKKYYECTPSEFRKKYIVDKYIDSSKRLTHLSIEDVLSKYKLYLDNNLDEKLSHKLEMISIDLTSKGRKFNHSWNKCISLCSAGEILKAVNQDALIEIQKEIGFNYVRIYSLFNKVINLYDEEENNFYWGYVDDILRFLTKINIKPIISIDNINIPLNKFIKLFKEFIDFCIDEYGIKEINTWRFEISNQYKEIYNKIVDIVMEISKNIKIEEKQNDYNRDYLYDTSFMGPYIIDKAINSNEKLNFIQAIDYICNDEKLKIYNSIFYGNSGLITSNGLKKSSYYAYYLLARLGKEIIDKGKGYIITREDNNIQILLYNYTDINDANDKYVDKKSLRGQKINMYEIFNAREGKEIIINLNNLQGDYKVIKYLLDEQNGSIFDYWNALGEPKKFSRHEIDLLKKSTFPKVTFDYIKKSNSKNLNVKLSPHGVVLINLEEVKKHSH